MKKQLLILILITFTVLAKAQTITLKAEVDERVELMSIVARMAGFEEYKWTNLQSYGKEIDLYFKPFLNDSLIKYTKKIRKQTEVAYDAVMTMAVHLRIKDNQIGWKENLASNSLSDKRWKNKSETFVRLLSKFYQTSNFHNFFMQHQSLYQSSIAQYDTLFGNFDLSWFSKFFGTKTPVRFYYMIGFSMDGGGYGPRVIYQNGNIDIFSIVGVLCDEKGKTKAKKSNIETTVHEFCHTYCNPIVDKNYPFMEAKFIEVFNLVKDTLLAKCYHVPKTIAYESLVRACTIMNLKETNMSEMEISNRILQAQTQGFLMVPAMVSALEQYEKKRNTYSNLDDFMPLMIDQINSSNLKLLYDETINKFPKINSFSINNESKNVDPNIHELKIKFNQPMDEFVNGWETISSFFTKPNVMPEMTRYNWDNETHKELTIIINMKPNTKYKIYFPINQMRSSSGLWLNKNYSLSFKTGNAR